MDAGTIIGGKYRLTRELGRGAMGSVWAAVHTLLDREVAIKFLNPSLEEPGVAQARFVAEAKASGLVKNRFVVDVFDFGIADDGVSYMVQELLQGEPLSDVMCDGPAFTLHEAVRFVMDCLSGLSAVHERGIVHRDLKPENIFVLRDREGITPKLLDFGISKYGAEQPRDRRVPRPSLRTSGRARLTAVGSTLGTPAYMSPEQLRNLSTLDARADIYSLGVVFYEWLVGHCPYATTMNFAELVDRIEGREMEPLAKLRPDIGVDLCTIVARAIEPDREQRFESAADMRAALGQALERLPDVETRLQNEALPKLVLPALPPLPKGLPLPASVTYRAPEKRPVPPKRAPRLPEPAPALGPRLPISEGVASLRPAGLSSGPSRSFWIAALAAGVVLAALPIAWRARSRDVHRPAPLAAPSLPRAVQDTLEPPHREADLPLGALPPEIEQEHEAPPIEATLAPAAAPEPARKMRDEAHHHHARRHVSAPAAPRVQDPGPSAPAPKPAPTTAPTPSAPTPPGKLLRSLDF